MASDNDSEQQPVSEQTQDLFVDEKRLSTSNKVEDDSHHGGGPPPPNDGLVAWTQVAGAFFLFFNTWYVAW